jgi:hypothetical protein
LALLLALAAIPGIGQQAELDPSSTKEGLIEGTGTRLRVVMPEGAEDKKVNGGRRVVWRRVKSAASGSAAGDLRRTFLVRHGFGCVPGGRCRCQRVGQRLK